MQDTSHYFVGLTDHALIKLIFDWNGNVSDCSILQSQLMEVPVVQFESFNQLAVLYGSHENQNNLFINQTDDSGVK